MLNKSYFPIKEVQNCFEYVHPVSEKDFNVHKEIKFKFEKNTIIHGFAGYFSSKLYGDIFISTIPYSHTPCMISWFPMYFPSLVIFK